MFEKTRAIMREEKARKKARDKKIAPKKLEQLLAQELKEMLDEQLTVQGNLACTIEVQESDLGVFQRILNTEIQELYDFTQTSKTTWKFSAKQLAL